ncbi:M23 family metallopeptidase [Rickettsiales endosymbiont of Peranema trichophorum]|uniref:M23 family metallopeptidase n=1 Tax=Rickettsiales endosymbiont of Peranema trichophorum TaxID=2486577 RepID=UPI0013EE7176|nr:M23 family metallopeptidase [Rickettsiales endosymbiont of Peranema trichophorum]
MIPDRLHVLLLLLFLISSGFNIFFYTSFRDVKDALETLIASEEEIDMDEDDKVVTDDSKFQVIVQQGDTLHKIFADAGISTQDSYNIVESIAKVYDVSKLGIGSNVEIKFLQEPQAKEQPDDYYSKIEYIKITTDKNTIDVTYDPQNVSYSAVLKDTQLLCKEEFAEGIIDGSLYVSAANQGISNKNIMKLINIFSHDVDFQRDIHTGDKFEILYKYYTDETGNKKTDGDIIFASLTLGKTRKEIFKFEASKDYVDYFDNVGQSTKKTLLRTPINGARITSGYGMRKHPILGYSKMHKGLDYGAPKGTPIFAAGDGVVEFVKISSRGYGKHLKIKHSSKYATLYAHLDRFGKNIKQGARVRQGQVIGFVGNTGSTDGGAHLHYEVHDRNQQVNPNKISFAKSPPLSGTTLELYKKYITDIHNKIRDFRNNKSVASNIKLNTNL